MIDERMLGVKIGKPIPEWDLRHRLPTGGSVGPERKDSVTTFRINSSFMEVTEQPHMNRQLFGVGVLIAFGGALVFGIFFLMALSRAVFQGARADLIVLVVFLAVSAMWFTFLTLRFGRLEFFARTRFPVRFNRRTQTVYALKRRSKGVLDFRKECELAECKWDSVATFCIHREQDIPADHYSIRCYQLDENENVTGAFSIGRDWDGKEGLQELLAQWNYWCCYMNDGPAAVPKPVLFLPTKETPHESFLYCVYAVDFNASPGFRIAFLPMFIMLAIPRILSLWTSREPVWPDEIARLCAVDPDDPFNEPTGDTPVGWHATTMSKREGRYPTDLRRPTEDWPGDTDLRANALRWAEDVVQPVVPAVAPACMAK